MSRFLHVLLIAIFAASAGFAQPPALSSLSSAGSSASSQGSFRVRLASGLTKQLADTLKADVTREGYPNVEVVEANGSFNVMVGAAQGEEQARSLLKDLRAAGFTPEQVVGPGSDTSVANSLPAGMPTTGDKVFRVQVYEFPNATEAENGKKALRDEGFSDVDVVADGGQHKVLLGTFKQRDQAEKLLADVKNAGFSLAQVTESEQRAIGGATTEIASLPAAAGLSAADKEKAQDLLKQIEEQRSGNATAESVKALQELIQQQNEQIKLLLAQQNTARDQSADVSNQVWQLYREFDSLLLARRTDQAAQVLERVRAIAPAEPSLPSKLKRLEQIRSGGDTAVAGGPAGAKGPDPEKVQATIAEARKAEVAGDMATAQQKYNEVLGIDPQNTEARGKLAEIANRQIETDAPSGLSGNKNLLMYGGAAVGFILLLLIYWQFVNARREKKLEQRVEELTRGGALAGGAGSVATSTSLTSAPAEQTFVDPLAPGGVYESSAPMTATPPAGTSMAGASAMGGTMMGSGMEMPNMGNFNLLDEDEEKENADSKQNATPPPAATPTPTETHEVSQAGESDMVSISGMDFNFTDSPPASLPAAPPPSMAPSTTNESVSLDDMNFNFPPPPVGDLPLGANAPSAPNATPPSGLPDFNLDELLKGTFPGATPGSEADENLAGPSARIQDITPVSLPGLGDIAAPPELKPAEENVRIEEVGSAGIAAAIGGLGTAPTVQLPSIQPSDVSTPSGDTSSGSPAVHFEQGFDNDAVGSQPGDWKGDYDYASLTVDDQSANGGGRCLKFEKRSGAGSASYHCRFPNAAGMVTVEFDIRCDDKNKYLLGFYVEKDEDFKQSVHTIVHRIDSRSQPSLRIQGEPVPYELGTWRHVRYELNLLMGMVNAYVNDQHVVKDAKLPTIPSYVNTLSIRDNLATTGLLYLDNIRITRK